MFACMGVLVKHAAIFFSNTELVFYRSLVGLVATFFIMRAYCIPLATDYWKIHCWRGLAWVVGARRCIVILLLHFATTPSNSYFAK